MPTKGHVFLLLLILGALKPGDSFLTWFFNGKDSEAMEGTDSESSTVTVSMSQEEGTPFELKTTDEKFLMEAQLTADLSPLDACHHMVI